MNLEIYPQLAGAVEIFVKKINKLGLLRTESK